MDNNTSCSVMKCWTWVSLIIVKHQRGWKVIRWLWMIVLESWWWLQLCVMYRHVFYTSCDSVTASLNRLSVHVYLMMCLVLVMHSLLLKLKQTHLLPAQHEVWSSNLVLKRPCEWNNPAVRQIKMHLKSFDRMQKNRIECSNLNCWYIIYF